MKIQKIEILNFRWIRWERILDFTKQDEISKLLVLDWENWFWKTTIFDAIEFCLTWSIKRLKDLPNFNVQKNILKNQINGDTYIKIIFEKGEFISIFLDKTHWWQLNNNFKQEGNDKEKILKNINIKDFKNIFYIPQDDSTELLKCWKWWERWYSSYIDKHIWIKEEVEYKNRVLVNDNNSDGRIIKSIDQLITNIWVKKSTIEKELKNKNKELGEKKKNSFFIKKIDFIENEILSEYNKKLKNKEKYTKNYLDKIYIPNRKKLLNLVQNQNWLEIYSYNSTITSKIKLINNKKDYFVKNYNYYLFYKENSKSKSEEIIKLENEIKLFKWEDKIRWYIDNLTLLKNNNSELNNILKLFPKLNSKNKFYIELLEIEDKFQKIKKKLKSLNEEQKEYNNLFWNLIDFWDKNFQKYENKDLVINNENDKIDSWTCPLCKTPNKTDDIKLQLDFLRKKSWNDIEKWKESLFSNIYNKELYEKIEEYLMVLEKQLKEVNYFEKIRKNIQNNETIFKDIEVSINKYYEESKAEKKEIKILNFNKEISSDEELINIDLLEDVIAFWNGKVKINEIDNDKFIELNTKYNDLFQKDYIFTENIIKELKEDEIKNNIDYFENELIKLKDNEKKILEKEIKILENEIEFYELRIKFLKFTNEEILDKYSKKLKNNIDVFKDKKIKSIALPFYIFNQKIVKNFYWMRFYLTKDSITWENWFKNPMYSLSSWQAEWLALSLMLSNNLSYQTKFKTLLIDDPIQSLDDLNILSFINLLRYQFPNKQIIISTHDDWFSRFIRYKFWRLYWDNTQKNINMKEEFFKNKLWN